MKFGMNLLLWTGNLTDDFMPTLQSLKQMGYDGVEVPIFEPDEDKFANWAKRFDDLGLERVGLTVRGAEDNPISSDAVVRARGVEAVQRVVDSCKACGCELLVGPYHSAIGEFTGVGPTEDEWKWGVESMRKMAEYAGQVGVTLVVECLNRFELYFLNAHADSARFVRQVNHPNCRMMYDTFHANIEEKNILQTLQGCADVMVHVHISENDRSTPGKGNVRWEETFDALKQIGYDGWMSVEAFGLALPELAAATKIWRQMYESEEQLARDALQFMRQEVAKRW